jgi:hypothetical protein
VIGALTFAAFGTGIGIIGLIVLVLLVLLLIRLL